MQIINIDYGFIQIIENNIIEKIVCQYDGICTIYFYDKPPKKINIGCEVYNRQYGISISENGSNLFFGSWGKGLLAYDIESGKLLWKSSDRKIRHIFVYTVYLIALSLHQLNIADFIEHT
jgi:hypothetical protein